MSTDKVTSGLIIIGATVLALGIYVKTQDGNSLLLTAGFFMLMFGLHALAVQPNTGRFVPPQVTAATPVRGGDERETPVL